MSRDIFTKKLAAALVGGTLSLALHAATTSGPYEVKSIILSGQGAHIEVAPNPQPCTANWAGTQFLVKRTQVFYQEVLSMAMAAQTANQKVIIWWNPEGTADCSFLNQLVVDAIQMKK